MPRLKDLLEYLNEPGLEDIWILLDIKVSRDFRKDTSGRSANSSMKMDNNSDDVMRLIAATLHEVKPSPKKIWADRVLLGIWSVSLSQEFTRKG
jgi:hypothetical protein